MNTFTDNERKRMRTAIEKAYNIAVKQKARAIFREPRTVYDTLSVAVDKLIDAYKVLEPKK